MTSLNPVILENLNFILGYLNSIFNTQPENLLQFDDFDTFYFIFLFVSV
jgi:hypothetical protein